LEGEERDVPGSGGKRMAMTPRKMSAEQHMITSLKICRLRNAATLLVFREDPKAMVVTYRDDAGRRNRVRKRVAPAVTRAQSSEVTW
jgi:hypothetical protein